MISIEVYLLPALAPREQLVGRSVAVIDVLRATTTIAAALAAGAREVVACLEIDDARRIAAGNDKCLLGGERGGLPIEGFDLGNSPCEYTAARVGGERVVFTTTNGTAAMLHALAADQALLAAFTNRRAVVETLRKAERIAILCSGTRGEITREDTLLAGRLVDDLLREPTVASEPSLNDQARIARDAWRAAQSRYVGEMTAANLAGELAETQGGLNLRAIGLATDIADAAALDRHVIVPRLDLESATLFEQRAVRVRL
jgi:2-phosphosulfolactate phosphatase